MAIPAGAVLGESRIRRALLIALLLGVVLAVGSGCALTAGPLENTSWKLTEWTLSSLTPADFQITAAFSGGRISGKGAVNTYGGPYTAGPGSAFSVGQVAATQMAGPEPAMRAETAYLTLLGQAKSYKVAGKTLTLYDKGGNESLIFQAATK